MFLLFTDSKQHKARELVLITLRSHAPRVFSKLSFFRQQQQKERRFTVPDHFRSQTIFGLGDALSLVACVYDGLPLRSQDLTTYLARTCYQICVYKITLMS